PADKAIPGDAVEAAGGTARARDLDMATESGKRPVERAREPWHVLVARQRRASPLIAAVEEPDAGIVEPGGDGGNIAHVRRARAFEPAARERVHDRQRGARRARQPIQAIVAQGLRPDAALDGLAKRPAIGDVDHGNAAERGHVSVTIYL